MSAHPAVDARPVVAAPRAQPYLEGLTPSQQAVVLHNYGPLLVYAGPGAGKTTTIAHRVTRLVAEGLARPSQILAMTFTVRAAEEMRGRLAHPALLGSRLARSLTVGTFHSMCAQVLRHHATVFGRSDAFTIYDPEDVGKIVERLLRDPANAAVRDELETEVRNPRSEVVRVMSLAKNHLMSPAEYLERSDNPVRQPIAHLWEEVAAELAASNAFDFDDLLTHAYSLFFTRPTVLEAYRRQWPWILVDEHQDNNGAQIWLIALLAGQDGNITAVADDDQSIFGWRGAQVGGTLRFGQYFPTHATVVLRENFRCTSQILNAAMRCVAYNSARVAKDLTAVRGSGGPVESLQFENEHAEATWLTSEIAGVIAAGGDPREIHVIARSAYLTVPLQRHLTAAGIAHRVLGDLGFFERKEVKDALAYLELLVNASDARALQRALSNPRRRVGEVTVAQIIELARAGGVDLIAGCRHAASTTVVRTHAAREALVQFADGLSIARSQYASHRLVRRTVSDVLNMRGGLVATYRARADGGSASERTDAQRVLEDLASLSQAAATFDKQQGEWATLAGFVESVALLDATEVDAAEDRRLTISTIHRAKGTESDLIVLIGCEEGTLPQWRAVTSATESAVEEERRLFYVAATRARNRLILTRAREREGRPRDASRFLTEAGL